MSKPFKTLSMNEFSKLLEDVRKNITHGLREAIRDSFKPPASTTRSIYHQNTQASNSPPLSSTLAHPQTATRAPSVIQISGQPLNKITVIGVMLGPSFTMNVEVYFT